MSAPSLRLTASSRTTIEPPLGVTRISLNSNLKGMLTVG